MGLTVIDPWMSWNPLKALVKKFLIVWWAGIIICY